MFPYKRCKTFSFSGTDQPVGKNAYKTFRETTTSTVKCHHTQTHGHVNTYSVGFHWGLPMKLCNLYRQLMHKTHSHNQFGGYMGKDIKDNNTTGLSHMKPTIEKEV